MASPAVPQPAYTHHAVLGCKLAVVRSQAPWPKPGEEDLPRFTCAAGCFWGPELHFQRVPGIVSTAVGYTGAHHG